MKKQTPKKNTRKEIVVAVSGGFDPIHPGHVRLIHEAKKLGTKLVVILNNDNWMQLKKGKPFMNEKERKEVLEALRDVDKVVLTNHKPNTKDMSVVDTLKKIKPNIFANGGDRKLDNVPEVAACEAIGCDMVFNVGKGGKIQSSSWLLANYAKAKKKKR